MFIIADEDQPKVKAAICRAITVLSELTKRVDLEVELGDGLKALIVTGYWVLDVIRIDIKVVK